jgi:hypothetical protein
MILVDFNHTAISSLLGGAAQMKKQPHDMGIDFFRHMVLNALRSYRSKFRDKYGDLVIVCDGPNSWRKEFFPPYKKNRKKARAASEINWKVIYEWMDTVRQEITDHLPYPVIRVEGAEADDAIAEIAWRESLRWDEHDVGPLKVATMKRTLIVSGDDDFMQLQRYPNVDQYLPVKGRFAKTDDPQRFLFEHILEGDTGDGIPNALSGDNVLITPDVRQKPLRAGIKEQAVALAMAGQFDQLEAIAPFFNRNEALIALLPSLRTEAADEVCKRVYEQYQAALNTLTREECSRRRQQLLTYFMNHRMKLLTEHLGEF